LISRTRRRVFEKENNTLKFRLITALSALVVLAASTAAFADTASMQFNGPSGNNANGEYTYPYEFTVNGNPMELMCISLFNTISPGETWTANVSSVASLWGTQDASLYDAAAWLFLQEQGNGNDPAINWAAWKLFYPGTDVSGIAGAQQWYDQAVGNTYTEGEFANVFDYQPTNFVRGGDSPQEFLGFEPVPEPSTLMLMGGGIIALGGVLRRQLI
jgi:PEP-CTERM motif